MARRHRAKLRDAFKILGEPLFDGGQRQRYAKLESLGDPLARLNKEINWEIFRSDLLKVYQKERKSDAGRKPIDVVLMFKILILQRLYNLSDDQAEYQIRDRASFQRFLGIYAEDGSPDAKTIWTFREQLGKLGIVESIFKRFDAYLIEKGLAAKGGQIVDATIVEVPRQRNTPEENKQIKEGVVPESWVENPKKLVQKDLDARWTMKRDETFYGYKNHLNVDAEHKFIRKYVVSDASVHDSKRFASVLDFAEGRTVFADTAYRSKLADLVLQEFGIPNEICERAYGKAMLTDEQKASNKVKSRTRARVEHVFGSMWSMHRGTLMRGIGEIRTKAKIGLLNVTYNLTRYVQIIGGRVGLASAA